MTTERVLAPHLSPAGEVARRLGVETASGLSGAEAAVRLRQFGPNRLQAGEVRSAGEILVGQFKDFLIAILIAAAVLAGVLGEITDAIAIGVILVLNAVLGFFQEYRAERAMAALQAMAAPHATVVRDRIRHSIPAADVVPGDVCVLEAGAAVPADMRLIETASLRVDEAALTGESLPVEKNTECLHDPETPLAERRNLAYAATLVTYGRGVAVVTATGMATEVGRIATLLAATESVRTPLQRRLDVLGRRLGVIVLAICAVIFLIGILRGESWLPMLLAAISLAVAAVPEALPAVVTISLALGARRMVRAHALIRRLSAVETLGSVTVICSDKTGTLTQNRMVVEEVVAWDTHLHVTGSGNEIEGKFLDLEGREVDPKASPVVTDLLSAAALCNDAEVARDGEEPGTPRVTSVQGDPTEAALVIAAAKAGIWQRALLQQHPRLGEVPFDGARKRMVTLHRSGDQWMAFVKGAADVLLIRSSKLATLAGDVALTAEMLTAIERHAEALAERGLRVLGLARRTFTVEPDVTDSAAVERELTFLGLMAMVDPPRSEAAAAVAECHAAGIRPVMITGDHPLTARTIAARLAIHREGDVVVSGHELEQMSDADLAARLPAITVFARVAPEHKLRIVRALQQNGEVVAMTGDGVNDAPALKQADIGVAMGMTGTDVAKQAAEMVLLDDRFNTIVGAVREGRRIYDNIRRFVRYMLAANSGEIWVMLLAPFFGYPLPLLPIQILWINLVTDGLPAIALALEPAERNVMSRPPRPPAESLFARGVAYHTVWVGMLLAALSLVSLLIDSRPDTGHEHWQTNIFIVLTLGQMAHVMAIRSEIDSLFRQGVGSNPLLLWAVVLTIAAQLAVVYVPWLQPLFHTQALSVAELAECVGLSLVIFAAVEVEKWLARAGLIYRD